jgi:hypothetical protein
MPNTTNFGWATPADTDLVKDGAAAIRTLGSSIDTSLVDLKGGTTGQVLTKASNTDLDFTFSSVDPLVILDAKGDLISATAADTPARLAVGANGTVLTADSAQATGLKWAVPVNGKVLQVVSSTTTTATTIASTSLTDTTITATITPSLSNSKVFVLVSWNCDFDRNAIEHYIGAKLLRGATTILDYGIFKLAAIYTGGARSRAIHSGAMSYLDSPATTSATTYKVQGAVDNTANSGTSTWQYSGAPSTITLFEIGA